MNDATPLSLGAARDATAAMWLGLAGRTKRLVVNLLGHFPFVHQIVCSGRNIFPRPFTSIRLRLFQLGGRAARGQNCLPRQSLAGPSCVRMSDAVDFQAWLECLSK